MMSESQLQAIITVILFLVCVLMIVLLLALTSLWKTQPKC